MNILGISCYFHDSAAVLLRDGLLLAAAEEERFTRKKHDYDFPKNAIDFCLETTGIHSDDLDYVVFFEKPFVKFDRLLKTALQGFPKTHKMFSQSMRTWLVDKLWVKNLICSYLKITQDRILFSEHHLSHAASAYFCSPFEESAVLTFDGVGEWSTTTYGVGKGSELELSRELRFPHSIGLLYSAFTAFLGFEINEGEYKVMGMAPYGSPKYVDEIWKVVHQNNDGSFWLDSTFFSMHYSTKRSYTKKLENLLGYPRDAKVPFFTESSGFPGYIDPNSSNKGQLYEYNQKYADIAASIQLVTEELILTIVNEVYRSTGLKKLCLAGGVALNSVANGRILKETPFDELYIQPSAGDGGGALGAALYAWHCGLGNSQRFLMDHAYWGTCYTNDQIKEAIGHAGARSEYLEEEKLIEFTADRLSKGDVIGWFQGKSEWGPRALGNRSILADPRRSDMKDIVNEKIKFREPFRPFAPSVLCTQADEYFDLCDPKDNLPARFMLLVLPINQDSQDKIPAVNHEGTARIQTVHQSTNPLYYDLIQVFGEITGIPILLNTSFNIQGEPIVNDPSDALRTFFNSGLDGLVLGNFWIDKG